MPTNTPTDATPPASGEAAQMEPYRQFYEGVQDCMEDTWQCERCGHAEPWWTESNADYATRKAVAALAALSQSKASTPGEGAK